MKGSPLVGQFLGDGWCVTDPAACPGGFSLSLWINVVNNGASNNNVAPTRAYLLSSGEHDSNSIGMSLFLYEGKLGMAITNGIDYWKIIQSKVFPLGKVLLCPWQIK